MSIRVRLTGPPLPTEFSDTKLMREIGSAMVGRIRSRTERGVSVDGSSFRPLSAGYAKRKSEAIGSRAANLTVSGRMLNDMQAKPTSNSVRIGFVSRGGRGRRGTFIQRSRAVGAEDKARWHNEQGAGKSRVKREFFGLSKEDEEFVMDRVNAFIKGKL